MPLWNRDRTVAELAPRWAQPPSSFVSLDGMRVHVRVRGSAGGRPPLVLVHGTGNSLHTWDGWAARLHETHRVVSFDRPGFGLTGPNPSGDYSMAWYAGFVLRLLDLMQIDRCVLVGNSAGGGVAWHVAAIAPRRVDRLILIASSGYPRTIPPSAGFRLAMSPIGPFLLHLMPRSSIATSVRETYGDPAKVTDDVIDRHYEVMMRAGNREVLGETLRQLAAVEDSALIRSIAAPTLILWGSEDRVVPPALAQRFAADIRDSRIVIFPGVGHLPQEEDPDGSVAALEAFLST